MKFLELKIGEYFEFQGARYQKLSLLIAVDTASGKQKMFKRASTISPLTPQGEPAPFSSSCEGIPRTDLLAAIAIYHQKNIEALHQSGLSSPSLEEAIKKINSAKQDFLASLNLEPKILS
jgi:benzoyl-CoA reductase/2-hydroxyglutaryl-CoA dehydratase subunit BcrC/BadD/HgdB